MHKPTCKPTFSEARDAFLKALTDYQTATRDMSVALEHVSTQTGTVYESLSTVLLTSSSLLAPRS